MSEEGVERKLAAILAADVAGYSRLMGADEEGTIAALRAHRREIFDPKIAQYHGRIANTAGDSLLIEFSSAVDALRCAIEVQQEVALRNEDVPDDRRLQFRIGINVGDIVTQGDDLLGDGVNVAARLEGLAEPGGICVSASVYDHIAGKVEIDFIDLGETALKNIERPIRVYALASATDDATKARQRRTEPSNSGDGAFDLGQFDFDRPSIVVMPFKDLGGGDQDSLAEGLRLSLNSLLVKLSGLFLLHTATVDGYRGQEVPAVKVGKNIGVRYVVEGAVQRSGDRVRVTIQLTDSPAGQLIWGERYDRVLNDIFELEDEIALEIVGALDIELRTGETGRAWWQGIVEPSAREFVHRGISHLYKGTKDDTVAARRMFEKLDELQPDWPQSLGLIALTHWRDAQFGWSIDPADSLEKAADFAQRAMDLGDPDGIGHAVIGHVRLYQRRHEEALKSCGEALARRPSCPLANGLLAEVMQYSGEPDRAIVQMKEAIRHVRIFPPWMVNILAASFRDNDNIDDSIAAANESVRLFPDELDGLVILCSDYNLSGSPDEAEEIARRIVRIDPSFTISRYAASQPYKDKATLDRIIEGLNRAGLPE